MNSFAFYFQTFVKQITLSDTINAQKTKFTIKDFFSKCEQIRLKLLILCNELKYFKWFFKCFS